MYPIFSSETLAKMKSCQKCQADFPISDKDMEFYSKISPLFPVSSSWGTKDPGTLDSSLHSEWRIQVEWEKIRYLIPSPTLCPDCRQQRRLAFRNERTLYKRKCDATGKDIISTYSEDKPEKVYEQKYWWSDAWDQISYGRDFDFSKSAFEQFAKLREVVPVPSLYSLYNTLENCEYTNIMEGCKNCYLCFDGNRNEDSLFCRWFWDVKNSMDLDFAMKSENCYACLDIENCSNCLYTEQSSNCSESIGLYRCENSKFCILSSNLTNKEYYIYNEPVSKKEYEKYRRDTPLEDIVKAWEEMKKKTIRKCVVNIGGENVMGDGILHSKNIYGYDIRDSENSKYIYDSWDVKNSMDCYEQYNDCSWSYECMSSWVYHSIGVHDVSKISESMYSNYCHNSSYLFLCTWLRDKKYCILNKQYTPEEYEKLVPKIIEKMIKDKEWGEFFSANMSPYGYNETITPIYYPLSREEVLGNPLCKEGGSTEWNGGETGDLFSGKKSSASYLGTSFAKEVSETLLHWPIFNWSDYEMPIPKVEKIIRAEQLPKDISKIPDDILNWAIECEVSGKPFRIIRQELEFYRKHGLSIPKRHPDVRHLDRMRIREPRRLFERKCDKCKKDILSTCTPERIEIVYCEECYDREVVS